MRSAHEESAWDRTGALLSFMVNALSGKGKSYTPSDFNPWARYKSKRVKPMEIVDDLSVLADVFCAGKKTVREQEPTKTDEEFLQEMQTASKQKYRIRER